MKILLKLAATAAVVVLLVAGCDDGPGPGDGRPVYPDEPAKPVEPPVDTGPPPPPMDNSCEYARDGICDERPHGSGLCDLGTDTADCGDPTEEPEEPGDPEDPAEDPRIPAECPGVTTADFQAWVDAPEPKPSPPGWAGPWPELTQAGTHCTAACFQAHARGVDHQNVATACYIYIRTWETGANPYPASWCEVCERYRTSIVDDLFSG